MRQDPELADEQLVFDVGAVDLFWRRSKEDPLSDVGDPALRDDDLLEHLKI